MLVALAHGLRRQGGGAGGVAPCARGSRSGVAYIGSVGSAGSTGVAVAVAVVVVLGRSAAVSMHLAHRLPGGVILEG